MKVLNSNKIANQMHAFSPKKSVNKVSKKEEEKKVFAKKSNTTFDQRTAIMEIEIILIRDLSRKVKLLLIHYCRI